MVHTPLEHGSTTTTLADRLATHPPILDPYREIRLRIHRHLLGRSRRHATGVLRLANRRFDNNQASGDYRVNMRRIVRIRRGHRRANSDV